MLPSSLSNYEVDESEQSLIGTGDIYANLRVNAENIIKKTLTNIKYTGLTTMSTNKGREISSTCLQSITIGY